MFKVKINVFRLIIIIIIFSIFNTILKIEANAQSNNIIKNYTTNSDNSINIYKVITGKAKVKALPLAISYELGTLQKGSIINVYNITNGWAKIDYNNKIGYIKLSQLEKVESVEIIKTGSVTIKYLDSSTKEELFPGEYLENIELKTYTYTAKDIQGYTLEGDETKTITITESNPNVAIEFLYNKNLSELPIDSNIKKGIFSWENTQCSTSMREDTYYWIDKLQLNEIYQANLFRLNSSEIIDFVTDLKINKNVSVYYLTGDPSWYNNPQKLIERINEVKNYNDTVGVESKVKGVVFDVEPWTLGDGKWSQLEYANTIKKAYEYAKAVDVEMIMVIPFWLEPINSEVIIANSDKTIVMNYNIKDPVKFIKEEIEIANKYNKKISSAAETKKTDANYGVDENTTYYYVGIDRLIQDWRDMYNEYKYDKIEFSLHDFNSVKDFINK